MRWSIRDLEIDETLPKRFYEVVKSHILLYRSSLRTRQVGWIEYVGWTTNEPARHVGYKSCLRSTPPEALATAYDEMMPFFSCWLDALIASRNWTAASDVVELLNQAKSVIGA